MVALKLWHVLKLLVCQCSGEGGGEAGQEPRSRPLRSRGRGRGGKGGKAEGDDATPEAVSETTSTKAEEGAFLVRHFCFCSAPPPVVGHSVRVPCLACGRRFSRPFQFWILQAS